MKRIIYIICPVIIGILTFIMLNSFLDKSLEYMLNTKDLSSINNEYGSIQKDRGIAYNNYISKQGNIMLQATSELNVPVSGLPTKFFPIEGMNDVTTVGRQAAQSLTALTILASQDNNYNENRKLAVVVSLQWFYGKRGISQESFQANFSPLQFYKVLENAKISKDHRIQYANRIDYLLTRNSEFLSERIYAKLYASNGIVSKLARAVFKPYFFARKNLLNIKDKGLLYRRLKKLPEKQAVTPRTIDWDEEQTKAEEQGQAAITNNDFYVNDGYYNENNSQIEKIKGLIRNRDLENSKEFDDYNLYLDICNDLGVKPYVIIMPTNGRWYDALDLKQDERDKFFDKTQKIAEDKGFEVLNLKDEEYTPYFMYDAVHFGWKGWLRVDEELYKHFKN